MNFISKSNGGKFLFSNVKFFKSLGTNKNLKINLSALKYQILNKVSVVTKLNRDL